jgi:hypothetical protein
VADVDVVTRVPDVGGCGHVRGVVVVVGAVIRRRVVLVISAHATPNLAQSPVFLITRRSSLTCYGYN